MPSVRLPLAAAALAGVLALASASGPLLLAGGVAIVQLVFAMGVVGSSELRSARPAAWLGLAAGLAALVWIERDGTADLTPVAVVLGPTVLAAFIIQLLRRDGRPSLNAALSLVVMACVLIVMPALWLSLRSTPEGVHTVGLALLGVGAVSLAESLPISRAVRRVMGVVVASTGAAVLLVFVESVGEAVPAVSAVVISAFAGVMCAVAFAVADRLAGEVDLVGLSQAATDDVSTDPHDDAAGDDLAGAGARAGGVAAPAAQAPVVSTRRSRAPAAIAPLRVVAPFVAAAPAAYVLGQLLVG